MEGILMQSLTPIADLDLLEGEYAALRPASPEERRALGLRRRAVAYAIVLRSCAGITAVVAEAELAQGPAMSAETLKSLVIHYARNNETGSEISRSMAVMFVAFTMFPKTLEPLLPPRPSSGPCLGCGCLWEAGGPLDRQSITGRTVAAMMAHAELRSAA
ncbi:hypothetical protein VQ042_08045 [Aurantimonas sp. A2-1-M11]|uniref:hypothetical protein n=1 Tax=Aurantimonas sp. A2-1-M11 TaxID=3113712 RepID=UPI002F94C9FE